MSFFYVEVVESDTNNVVKRIGPQGSERQADRVCSGVDINLNHDKFFTQTHESDTELETL